MCFVIADRKGFVQSDACYPTRGAAFDAITAAGPYAIVQFVVAPDPRCPTHGGAS
jgi:hypothetical protein